ncbi:unnamed protein product [Polarella glacialis]|uniref:SET domain-containing protein n=1 Tax=Polarella glacialis TaxID=89957 RepID=A0A813LQH0_POLGL|nr:unnamed protein product [Polarella glacialis]
MALRAVAAGTSRRELLQELRFYVGDVAAATVVASNLTDTEARQVQRLFDGRPRGPVADSDRLLFLKTAVQSSPCTPDQATFDRSRLLRIINFNGHSCPRPKLLQDQEGLGRQLQEWQGLFPLALINHACLANVTFIFIEDTVFVRAGKELEPGTELLTSYIKVFASLSERQAALDRYHMSCCCPRCQLEETICREPSGGASVSEFLAEIELSRAAVESARTFSMGCSESEMLTRLFLRVAETEASAKKAAAVLQVGFLILAAMAFDAYATVATLAHTLECLCEAASARARMSEMCEEISPFGPDHVRWALGRLEALLRAEKAGEVGVDLGAAEAQTYARQVVQSAFGEGGDLWQIFARAAGVEVEHLAEPTHEAPRGAARLSTG